MAAFNSQGTLFICGSEKNAPHHAPFPCAAAAYLPNTLKSGVVTVTAAR